MQVYLDFEKPIVILEGKIKALRATPSHESNITVINEIQKIQKKSKTQLKKIYQNLDPWQKTQVARHPARPHYVHYIEQLVIDFTPLSGDRLFSEDDAIIAGIGSWLGQRPVAIIGHEKGSTTQTRIKHNFGMARPEGYRKAMRIMDLAERFQMPIITLVDTPGAYPGIGSEERGQAEAIARCINKCLEIGVPLISVIIGEGGSGGALALATANRILMLEHSIYAVASPEACASILWRTREKAEDAAKALNITSENLSDLGIIDRILPEHIGGAHRNHEKIIHDVGQAVEEELTQLTQMNSDTLKHHRRQKFLAMGRSLPV